MGLLLRPSLAQRLGLAAFKQPRLSPVPCSFLQRGRRHWTNCAAECDGLLDYDDNDDAKAREKDAALSSALSRLSGDFCRESMMSMQRFSRSRRPPVISTGSLKLDLALGIGGLPKGRIIEIYGQEASGKTTLALHIIKEAQKLGGLCAFLDTENAMECSLAESMGINTKNLLFSVPDSAENMLCAVDTLTKSGSLDVIVVDSVAALVPQCELDAEIDGEYRDAQSRIITQALRKIHSSLSHSRTLIVFINQIRSSPKSGKEFGPTDEVTCGGNALKFYAAVRLRLKRIQLLQTEEKVTGLGISVQVVKNKLAPAMKKADLGIQFGRGLSCESEVLQLACEHGVIAKEGSNYLIGQKVFSNERAAEQCLAKNDALFDEVGNDLKENTV
ncbi:LOW QUALITY PROTEIN: DNA repair protein recA homolog 2, mitochondrial-like [Pyrus x bretschneideri]|uniref:LOW QUALITY PROTEIN: DNA repair protein recA homolog 2, mitochondrial-like n=1 Tax=Pyrus x bretschneideri TaxID=225117 RepID=UPI00202F5B62|nr:LOW QUALITY PROTEIN: DNA repair protein recA homolog 2, mitochondrial-like [Pyrus x bretschneideri]